MIEARDLFIDFIKTSPTGEGYTIHVFQSHEDLFDMNAINIKFLNDSIGMVLNNFLVSIDICSQGNSSISSERQAILWADVLKSILDIGCIKENGILKLTWNPSDIMFKDIPQDRFIHKNLTLSVKAFI